LHAFKAEYGLQHFWATIRGEASLGGRCRCPQCGVWWALAGFEGWDVPNAIGSFAFGFDCIDLVEDPGASLGMNEVALHSN
jgi:hypothetical protein